MSAALIKKLIPLGLKQHLVTYLHAQDLPLPEGRRSFVFLAADYGNIGDLAITAAQVAFLRDYAPGLQCIAVPISATRVLLRSIQRQIRPDDLVTIIGGGNMGSIYPDIEALRQLVIRSFPRNRIVCFPQTLDWHASAESERALQRLIKTYTQHPDLYVLARESLTHTKLSELFSAHANVKIALVPDIVMSSTAELLGSRDCLVPAGILRCLRDDKESALSAAQYAQLDAALHSSACAIERTDTHAGGAQLSEIQCAQLLADKLSQFRAAQLVVTDRLHGMILALLSGTPCLVLPNSNHKIRQTWLDWLSNHPRVIFVEPEQFTEIPSFIGRLLSAPRGALSDSPVDIKLYHTLQEALRSL